MEVQAPKYWAKLSYRRNMFTMKTNSYSGLAEAAHRSEIELMNQRIMASAGETLWVVGHRVTILPAGKGYTYVDVFSPALTPGPPPHRHLDCSELFPAFFAVSRS